MLKPDFTDFKEKRGVRPYSRRISGEYATSEVEFLDSVGEEFGLPDLGRYLTSQSYGTAVLLFHSMSLRSNVLP